MSLLKSVRRTCGADTKITSFFRNKTFALFIENSTEIIAYFSLSFLQFLFFDSIVTYFENIKNELNTAGVNGQYTRTHFLDV